MTVPDVFGLHVMEPTEAQIDAGAKALRAHEMIGKHAPGWGALPDSRKRKWRLMAKAVLRAAFQSR